MEFFRRAAGRPERLAILSGAFNPPTVAHLELLEAAARFADGLLCVMPRVLPHKTWHGASLGQRMEMLGRSIPPESCSLAVTGGGLFVGIARECREAYECPPELYFICGRDTAERVVQWDYGRPGAIEEMLEEFQLLVAPRGGEYVPPEAIRAKVRQLDIGGGHGLVSSSEVRGRIARKEPWEHLVPSPIVDTVRAIYS